MVEYKLSKVSAFARMFFESWISHSKELEGNALVYFDALADEYESRALPLERMAENLHLMLPRWQLGTIRRMLALRQSTGTMKSVSQAQHKAA